VTVRRETASRSSSDGTAACVRLSLVGAGLCALMTVAFAQAPDASFRLPLGDELRDCDRCPVMVVVPAGAFTMGSPSEEPGRDADEGPQRRVTMPASFAVGKFEVTFGEWDACVADGGCSYLPQDEIRFTWIRVSGVTDWFQGAEVDIRRTVGRGRIPVMGVSWDDAREYVTWLAGKTGKSYRLLTEAEWEYAARAGSRTAHSWGDTAEAGCDRANMGDAALREEFPGLGFGAGRLVRCRDGHAYLAPAGSFAANAFGLHDMTGNLLEWVEDCYSESYVTAPADAGPVRAGDCRLRVARGGSWFDDPRYQRVANRNGFAPSVRPQIAGFRVSRNLD